MDEERKGVIYSHFSDGFGRSVGVLAVSLDADGQVALCTAASSVGV